MKLTKREDIEKREHMFIFTLTDGDLFSYTPSKMEKEMLRIAQITDKISDKLLYLSEVAESIESQRSDKVKSTRVELVSRKE